MFFNFHNLKSNIKNLIHLSSCTVNVLHVISNMSIDFKLEHVLDGTPIHDTRNSGYPLFLAIPDEKGTTCHINRTFQKDVIG